MATDLKEFTVAEIAAPTENALSTGPFGSEISSKFFRESGIAVIRGKNLSADVDVRLDDTGLVFVSEEKERAFKRSIVKRGDLVFTCWGTINQVGLIDERSAYDRYLISNKQMKLSPDPAKVDSLFLYYLFSGPEKQSEILGGSIGSSVPGFNLGQLKGHLVSIPSLSIQEQIAHILGTLDDKIELNRRMNQTLEAMAQAIFKSWFVDFDPVKAKATAVASGKSPDEVERAAMAAISGKSEAQLDELSESQRQALAETASLFPSAFVESDLGEIPEGWVETTIGNVAERISMGPFGSRITRDNFVAQGVPVIRGGNLRSGFVEEGFVFLTKDKADELIRSNAVAGDIIFTHRGTIGQVGRIPDNPRHTRYVVSQSQMLLRADRNVVSSAYLYQHFQCGNGMRFLLSNVSQVGVPAIARPSTSLKAVPIVIPAKQLVDRFDDFAKPLFDKIVQNLNESRTLSELRDTLLPNLLSGTLSIVVESSS